MAYSKDDFIFICKYCGSKTPFKDRVCNNCKAKRKIMHGWNWLYKGKEIIKENK